MDYNVSSDVKTRRRFKIVDLSTEIMKTNTNDFVQEGLTGNSIELALERYASGLSIEDAACGILGANRFRDYLRLNGLTRSREESSRIGRERMLRTKRERLKARWIEIAERYELGESLLQIAESMGESRRAIEIALEEQGINVRSQAEANRIIGSNMTQDLREKRRIQMRRIAATPRSLTNLEKAALTKQEKGVSESPSEQLLKIWLKESGIETVSQQAVGIYNADLGSYPVAVEVFGGNFHASGRHLDRTADRCKYFADRGWSIVFVWTDNRNKRLTVEAANYVKGVIDQVRGNPSMIGKYWMIWGTGEFIASGGLDDHDLTLVMSSRRARTARA